MESCWKYEPQERPSAAKLYASVEQIIETLERDEERHGLNDLKLLNAQKSPLIFS